MYACHMELLEIAGFIEGEIEKNTHNFITIFCNEITISGYLTG
jgi:hypothetical protein